MQGYSYVAPSVLFSENVVSDELLASPPASPASPAPRLSASDVFASRFEESTFFQQYEMDLHEDALGDGSFSVCRRCVHRQTGRAYAVKIVSRRIDCSRETSLLRLCQGHPNIVELVEMHQDRAHTYIVMELLAGGELLQQNKKKPFTEQRAATIMRQLASAVRYMHARGVVHRDLKPENLVYAHAGDNAPIKVVDFGFARMKRACEPLHTPCFTLPYAAPEVLARKAYDESCDLWSMGAVLYSMISGESQFCTGSPDLGTRIGRGDIDLDGNKIRSRLSNQGRLVLKGLLTREPSRRLNASQLVNHSWFAGIDRSGEPEPVAVEPVFTLQGTR